MDTRNQSLNPHAKDGASAAPGPIRGGTRLSPRQSGGVTPPSQRRTLGGS